MSHVQSHHGGTDEDHNTFLVILKVHGDAIHLWPRDKMQQIGKTHSFTISCHNVETHSEDPGSDIQVFVLSEPSAFMDKCEFESQKATGIHTDSTKMAIFMTGPMASSRKASYAIDIGLSRHKNDNLIEIMEEDEHEIIATAYLYLDPKFSSQGIQRTPIIAKRNHAPIGQIQVEYLIVTNPIAHGLKAPKPDWLFRKLNLAAGHRGAGSGRRMDLPDELLENTIASFNYAHRNGADMCELDVLVSADGVPIVYHDFDVDAVAAQQSSDQLGKFRVQVDQLTVKQLRDFRLLSLHDGDGCLYTLNIPNQAECNRPFPTLEEVLNQVDETCGLNIEIKWPQMLESRKMEARKYREINDFVDRIINVVDKHAGNRRIILESFDADLVSMLRLKQNRFPVIFLSQGMTDKYERYVDLRTRSVKNGIYFAQAFDLAGIDLIMDYYLKLGKQLVEFINDHDLVARTWGDVQLDTLEAFKRMGIQCTTYDKIDLMNKMKQLSTAVIHEGQSSEHSSQQQQQQQQQNQDNTEAGETINATTMCQAKPISTTTELDKYYELLFLHPRKPKLHLETSSSSSSSSPVFQRDYDSGGSTISGESFSSGYDSGGGVGEIGNSRDIAMNKKSDILEN